MIEQSPQAQLMNQEDHTEGALVSDIEKKFPTEIGRETTMPSTVTNVHIPSITEIICDFNGSLGFLIGSSGFILSMYMDNWLPYFRYGSITWIWGCVFYTIPLMLKFVNKDGSRRYGCPWDIGDLGLFLCCLFYTIGCVFGSIDNEVTVEEYLDIINYMFVFGSFSLLLEPFHQVYLFSTRCDSFRSRLTRSKLLGDGSLGTTVANDTNQNNDTMTPLKINWDRCFELLATIFFCGAGIFGGFPPHPSYALPGVYFWEIGSIFAFLRSIIMLRKRIFFKSH